MGQSLLVSKFSHRFIERCLDVPSGVYAYHDLSGNGLHITPTRVRRGPEFQGAFGAPSAGGEHFHQLLSHDETFVRHVGQIWRVDVFGPAGIRYLRLAQFL